MLIRTKFVSALVILSGVLVLIATGIRFPPDVLNSKDLPPINSITIDNGKRIRLTDEEVRYWQSLQFKIANTEYPGETPDFIIGLSGDNHEFKAMFNKSDDIVFFSFVPEIEYGFLNSPPPGGWTKPLYKVGATADLLTLLKIE